MADQLWGELTALYNPEFIAAQIRADEELMRTIERLPPQRKTVFKLCKLEGKSYAEASRILNISEAAINDHITKANKFLFENFNKSLPLLTFLFCRFIIENM